MIWLEDWSCGKNADSQFDLPGSKPLCGFSTVWSEAGSEELTDRNDPNQGVASGGQVRAEKVVTKPAAGSTGRLVPTGKE